MALTANERIACFILQGAHTHREWTEFQRTIPRLMIKEVSSETVLICTDGKGWFKPMDWLGNYQNQMIQRYRAEVQRLRVILPDPRFQDVVFGEKAQEQAANYGNVWLDQIECFATREDWSPFKRLRTILEVGLTHTTDSGVAEAAMERLTTLLSRYPYQKP